MGVDYRTSVGYGFEVDREFIIDKAVEDGWTSLYWNPGDDYGDIDTDEVMSFYANRFDLGYDYGGDFYSGDTYSVFCAPELGVSVTTYGWNGMFQSFGTPPTPASYGDILNLARLYKHLYGVEDVPIGKISWYVMFTVS